MVLVLVDAGVDDEPAAVLAVDAIVPLRRISSDYALILGLRWKSYLVSRAINANEKEKKKNEFCLLFSNVYEGSHLGGLSF